MSILGIDASLTHTGCVILNKSGDIVFSKTIKGKNKGVERLSYIKNELKKILISFKPLLVVIEGYAFSPNQGRSFSIGELGGIIKLFLFANKISFLVVAPTTLKKFATGKGNSPKSTMEKEIYKNWKVELQTEHEVDAFGLAMMGLCVTNNNAIMNKTQREAVETVLQDKSKQNYLRRLK